MKAVLLMFSILFEYAFLSIYLSSLQSSNRQSTSVSEEKAILKNRSFSLFENLVFPSAIFAIIDDEAL